MSNSIKEKIFFVSMSVFSFILYFKSLRAGFIFDDIHMIVNNSLLHSPANFIWFFKGYVTSVVNLAKGMCRPLLMLTFGFNYFIGGLNPQGYHIVNLLLHLINAVLLYNLLKILLKNSPTGLLLILTGLFIVHPLNSEAIIYVSCRSDLLFTLFTLAAFIFYLRKNILLSLLFYIPALLTKETALCFPLLILAYDAINSLDNPENNKISRNTVLTYAGLALITAAYLFYRKILFSNPLPLPINRSLLSNIFIQSDVTLLYLKLFILPLNLDVLHYVPSLTSLAQPLAFWSLSAIILFIAAGIFLAKKRPLISLGIAWTLVGLAPKFYARLYNVACEHHFYMPSLGLYIIAAAVLSGVYIKYKKYFIYASLGILILFSSLTWIRAYEYSDQLLFWEKSVQRNPKSGSLRGNLGLQYLNAGMYSQATVEFNKALLLAENPSISAMAKFNIGNIYLIMRDYPTAIYFYRASLSSANYPLPGAYLNMGNALINQGKNREAVEAWKKEIYYNPESSEAFFSLGKFYLANNDIDKAKHLLIDSVNLNPGYCDAFLLLARIFEKENNLKTAAKMYYFALKSKPSDPNIHYLLGSVYARAGKIQALDEFKETIHLNPDFKEAYNDLAVAYASMNPPDWQMAKKNADKAKTLGYPVPRDLLKLIEQNTLNH